MNVLLCVAILGGCNVCVQQQVVKQNIVAAPVVTTPAYAAVYVPIADPYWSYTVGQEQRLREEIRQLREDIRSLRGSATQPPNPTPEAEPAWKAILRTNCLACHSGEDAKPKDDPIRLDGDINPAMKALVKDAIESGRMPKGRDPLSDEDFQVIAKWAGDGSRGFLREAAKGAKP